MKIIKAVLYIVILTAAFGKNLNAQDTLSYTDLIDRLYDMEYLASPPKIGEESGSFSSYDRRSHYDPKTDVYKQWAANGDGSGFIRKEGEDIVVFEKDGPGVIWRFWSALAEEGHIKIYVDHAEEPIIDKPFKDFFEKFEDDIPPMNLPNMVMTLSRGRNHWLPIPFNKHCKIVLSKNWGAYYHITYSNYPNTKLPDYDGSLSKQESIKLAKADRFLGNRGYSRKNYPNEKREEIKLEIKGGQRVKAINLKGNKAITNLQIKSSELEKKETGFLKDLLLNMTWDNENKPAVNAPIGIFFGLGKSISPYRTLPSGLIGDRLYSNWYMPFSKLGEIEIVNRSDKNYSLHLEVTYVDLEQDANELMRFHTKWTKDDSEQKENQNVNKRDNILIDDFEDELYQDWTVSGTAFGKGPVKGSLVNQTDFYEYQGEKLVNSYLNGDASTGTMVSKAFSIKRKYINFLIGGGAYLKTAGVHLLVNGKVVRSATGVDNEELFWASWDVSEFEGQMAQIKIVDNETGGFGHINVDQIYLSDLNKGHINGRSRDWAFLETEGKGRFCGITLNVENRWKDPSQEAEKWWYGRWSNKTIDWWWGEGDEKFFVDGEKFPSTFGTGSEDYIGYAWSAEPPFPTFDSPFASQPQTPIDGNGHTVVNRFHISDNIPFQKSFEASIERYKNKRWGYKHQNISEFEVLSYYYLYHE